MHGNVLQYPYEIWFKKDDDTMKKEYEESRKSIEEEMHKNFFPIMRTNLLKIYPRFIQD